MTKNLIAKSAIDINSSIDKVWNALTNPELIKKYMFGTEVISDWKVGSKITWRGEWKGKSYEDKGTILQIKPNEVLQYDHFSPLSNQPDIPENYHTVTITLEEKDQTISVTLTQDNNSTEQSKEHSENNWKMMLSGLKELLESS